MAWARQALGIRACSFSRLRIERNFEVCGEAVDGVDAIEKTAFSEERRMTWQSREQ
jgi:hypothetical protein